MTHRYRSKSDFCNSGESDEVSELEGCTWNPLVPDLYAALCSGVKHKDQSC